MQEQRQRQERRVQIPALAVSKRFGRYKKEERKEEREAEVKENEVLKKLKIAFQSFLNFSYFGSDNVLKTYPIAKSLIQDISYDSKDVEKFSIVLIDIMKGHINLKDPFFFSDFPGVFLSALINCGTDQEYTIQIKTLEFPMLGFENTKDVRIEGNVGDNLGGEMRKGVLILNGNADSGVGTGMEGGKIIINGYPEDNVGNSMKGGVIVVNNNAGKEVGFEMTGGKIIIEGNAGDSVGWGNNGGCIVIRGNAGENIGDIMCDGEIHIHGEIGSIGNVIHGKIYHRGRLIVDK